MLKSIRIDHSAIYFGSLSLLIISLPLSRFSLSVSELALLGNWLLEGKFRQKLRVLLQNKPALVLISMFLIHIIGLIYTTDFKYASNDIRIKLPLLALPVIFATSEPLAIRKFNKLLLMFVGAVIASTWISFGILLNQDVTDVRAISPFISPIRLSLNICLAIFISGYFALTIYRSSKWRQILFVLTILWLIAFIIISESGTGVYVLLFTSFILIFYEIKMVKNGLQKFALLAGMILLPAVLVIYLYSTVKSYFTPEKDALKNLDLYTAEGHRYDNDTINYPVENGKYVGLYICHDELKREWSTRSAIPVDSFDIRGQEIKYTLIRYLNSKGLRKDAAGVDSLTDKDVKNIESGIANYYFTKKISLNSRIYKILWEYQSMRDGGNPSGQSIGQRIEYWKTSLQIIKEHFWIGVGTGDLERTFRAEYDRMHSKLAPEFRHRSHNQFLAFFVGFGIFGFLLFVFTLIYPPLKLKMFSDFLYLMFFIIILLSMLVEDTLETQQGVTLYAFFNSLLLFSRKR